MWREAHSCVSPNRLAGTAVPGPPAAGFARRGFCCGRLMGSKLKAPKPRSTVIELNVVVKAKRGIGIYGGL